MGMRFGDTCRFRHAHADIPACPCPFVGCPCPFVGCPTTRKCWTWALPSSQALPLPPNCLIYVLCLSPMNFFAQICHSACKNVHQPLYHVILLVGESKIMGLAAEEY